MRPGGAAVPCPYPGDEPQVEFARFLAMKSQVKRCVIAVALTTLFGFGCVTAPSGILVVDGVEQDDIPAPADFEFVGSETYEPPIPDATMFRSWKGVYKGPGHLQDIGPWYVGAMQEKGWKINRHFKTDVRVYQYFFIKGDEEAKIQIEQTYNYTEGKSTNIVTAEVHPRGTESFSIHDLQTLKESEPALDAIPETAATQVLGEEPKRSYSPKGE